MALIDLGLTREPAGTLSSGVKPATDQGSASGVSNEHTEGCEQVEGSQGDFCF